jgi:hypothetical protein
MSSYAKDFKGTSRDPALENTRCYFEYITSMVMGGILCNNHHAKTMGRHWLMASMTLFAPIKPFLLVQI